MRPPPFQPPTQGLPRLSREEIAAAGGMVSGVGAGPRITDSNTRGLESVGPRPGEVRRPEADRGDSREGRQNPTLQRTTGAASTSPRRTPAKG